jgi:hypothetical protein
MDDAGWSFSRSGNEKHSSLLTEGVLLLLIMGDANPKNKHKQQVQHDAKKAGNQKKPVVSTFQAPGKKK